MAVTFVGSNEFVLRLGEINTCRQWFTYRNSWSPSRGWVTERRLDDTPDTAPAVRCEILFIKSGWEVYEERTSQKGMTEKGRLTFQSGSYSKILLFSGRYSERQQCRRKGLWTRCEMCMRAFGSHPAAA